MKVLILNSGRGNRMEEYTSNQPKCLTKITDTDTILSRQLKQLVKKGIEEVIITTGYLKEEIIEYCKSLNLPLKYKYINNEKYNETNYIYSIYLARKYLEDDILLIHGDLVFDDSVLSTIIEDGKSSVVISTSANLSEKDFKAVIAENRVINIGVSHLNNAYASQPMYYLRKNEWLLWLNQIISLCENGNITCYAEDALNEVFHRCIIVPTDIKNLLCQEIDTPVDLMEIKNKLENKGNPKVYMCFSSDIIHSGHIKIIQKAAQLGKLTIGILSDEIVASYKRFPIIPYNERKNLMKNISGIEEVVLQDTLSYINNLQILKPDYVVHGDDWKTGFQKPIREEVIETLKQWGGQLIEYPYSNDKIYSELENRYREQLSMPDIRRGRLRKILSMKKTISIIESHSGITGLIAEKTTVYQEGKAFQFDGMWVSSLCDSTAKGKPDIELVDMSSRMRTIDDIMEVTTKPIILDGDTGGQIEHFVYNVRSLERVGVSAVIIEDKTGLKKNSLFGTEVEQTQDTIEHFCEKISAGKQAQKTKEFMIIARIESLILEKGMEDALNRAFAYVNAGADGIMIHSRKKDPSEIFEFCNKFRAVDKSTYLVVVPTSFNEVTEREFKERGINIVIYANQLTRSGFPAMQKVAEAILSSHRAKEADDMCMPIKEILNLIPEEY